MLKELSIIKSGGYVLIDVLLGAALFVMLITFIVPAYLYGEESMLLAGERQRATAYAEEGLEALRNIRDSSYVGLTDGTYGLATSTNGWALSGTSNTDGEFTRQIYIEHASADRVVARSTVNWQQNMQRSGLLTLESRLSNFAKLQTPTGSSTYSIVINSDWYSGYCATVNVSTSSSIPIAWNINVNLNNPPTNGIPNNVWNANWSFTAPIMNVSGIEGFNQIISSSTSASFGYCADRPSLPISIFASASTPADNGTNTGPNAILVPPASMLNGDLIIMMASYRGAAGNLAILNAGGQTWNSFTQRNGTNIRTKIFYAIYNGTWVGNPSVTIGTGNTGVTIAAHIFRNVDPYTPIDTWESSGTFTAPVAQKDVTINGLTTTATGSIAIAFWATPDDNTWGLRTAGWANIGLAQYRNLAGSDSSISSAYRMIATPGASGNVINRQLTLGGDNGNWHIFSIRKRQ